MDRVNWLVALQHCLYIRESNYGSTVQIIERFENVQTVSEYRINFWYKKSSIYNIYNDIYNDSYIW